MLFVIIIQHYEPNKHALCFSIINMYLLAAHKLSLTKFKELVVKLAKITALIIL